MPFNGSFAWLRFSQVTIKAYGSPVMNKLRIFFLGGGGCYKRTCFNIKIPREVTQNVILVHVYDWQFLSIQHLHHVFKTDVYLCEHINL